MRKTLLTMAVVIALALGMMAPAMAEEAPIITSPADGEIVLSDVLHLSAENVEDDVRWAVRKSDEAEDPTCIGQTDVAGNVRELDDEAVIKDGRFDKEINRETAELEDGAYCFAMNQGAAGDGSAERAVVFFYLATPDSKDACKNGGWETFGDYRNQGQCVSEFARQQRFE